MYAQVKFNLLEPLCQSPLEKPLPNAVQRGVPNHLTRAFYAGIRNGGCFYNKIVDKG